MKKNSIPQTVNSYEIRTMEYNDLGRVLEIYQEGISSKIATFQEQSDEKSWMKIHLEQQIHWIFQMMIYHSNGQLKL